MDAFDVEPIPSYVASAGDFWLLLSEAFAFFPCVLRTTEPMRDTHF